jgi:hypothetical protein
MSDLEALLERLLDGGVEFVIVGGYAATAHGATRLTKDVDICTPFTASNLLKLQRAIVDLHPYHRLTPRKLPLHLTPARCRGLKNLYLATDLGVLDCLGEILGVGDFRTVRRHSVLLEIDAGKVRVLALRALIKAKEALSLPRDRQALVELRALNASRRQR